MTTVLATIDQAITAADQSQAKLPIGLFNQALAAFDSDGIINNVLWAGAVSGIALVEGVSGQLTTAPFTTATNLPTITAADAQSPEKLPPLPGFTVNSPTMNLTLQSARGARMPVANFTASWSVAFVTYWDGVTTPGISGIWAIAANAANAQKAAVWGGPNGLRMGATFTPTVFEDTRAWRVGMNVILVCFDATKRQFASYVNGQTAVVSAEGMGANPAPAPAAAPDTERWFMGMQPSASPFSAGFRGPSWATFSDSLHHNPKLAARRRQLIQAAADGFAIPLS